MYFYFLNRFLVQDRKGWSYAQIVINQVHCLKVLDTKATVIKNIHNLNPQHRDVYV